MIFCKRACLCGGSIISVEMRVLSEGLSFIQLRKSHQSIRSSHPSPSVCEWLESVPLFFYEQHTPVRIIFNDFLLKSLNVRVRGTSAYQCKDVSEHHWLAPLLHPIVPKAAIPFKTAVAELLSEAELFLVLRWQTTLLSLMTAEFQTPT